MYGFSKDQTKSGSSPIEVGVEVPNCELVDCKYISGEKAGRKWQAIEFTFKKGAGYLNKRIFEVGLVRPLPNETQEAANERAFRSFNTILRDIAVQTGTPIEEIEQISGSSFQDVITDYCNIVKKYNNNIVWLKVGKNKSGYNDLCTDGRFIEKYDSADTTGPGFVYSNREQLAIDNSENNNVTEQIINISASL